MELKFNQNMFNRNQRVITTYVDYDVFRDMVDNHPVIHMRSEHTGEVRSFYWNDKGGHDKRYYYNEDMDVYLCIAVDYAFLSI